MREHQFGRVENMSIRAGQPLLDRDLKVVRVACLGGESSGTKPPAGDEFELKRAVCDLFDELARLGHGTVVRLGPGILHVYYKFARFLKSAVSTINLLP